MEYTDERHGARMVLSDRPNVLQLLRYRSDIAMATGSDRLLGFWRAAQHLIEKWECDLVAQNADLGQLTNPEAADVITWAGVTAWTHFQRLEDIPKNS